MKFIGMLVETQPWVGVLDGGGTRVRPLAPLNEFWADPRGWQERAGSVDPAHSVEGAVERDRAAVTEIPIVPAGARILCIGLNYQAHAEEGSFSVPDYPTIFGRWVASLSVGEVGVPIPHGEEGLDWEGEVAAYLACDVHAASPEQAEASILGYSTFNDLTARRAQKLTAQWTLGKNGDLSGPMGPLVTRDEVGRLQDGLAVKTRVNGEEVQNGNTRDMIFSVESIIELVSQTFTLHAGDVIVSGTPEGVGYVRTPPWFLHAGDVVEVEIERLGVLRTPIVASKA